MFQVVGIGNVGVGKTSLIKHFCESKVGCATVDTFTVSHTRTHVIRCVYWKTMDMSFIIVQDHVRSAVDLEEIVVFQPANLGA